MCEVVSKNIALKNNNIVFPQKPIVFPKNPLFSNMCTFYPIVLKRKIITGRTLNLNCCTQQENCNSGLPAPYYY